MKDKLITTGDQHLAWWCERLVAPSFVYVIQAQPETPVKVGVAKDVYARMAVLQTGNPYRLKLLYVFPGGYELECQLHRKLAKHRLEGEWFEAEAAGRLFSMMYRLADAMVAAYDGKGEAPTYRQKGFSWERYEPVRRASGVTVRHVQPTPVPADVAEKRLATAWMRPRVRSRGVA